MKLIALNGRAIDGASFSSLTLATSFGYGCQKPQRIILGDYPCFWVVCPADAERLIQAGYDYAD